MQVRATLVKPWSGGGRFDFGTFGRNVKPAEEDSFFPFLNFVIECSRIPQVQDLDLSVVS